MSKKQTSETSLMEKLNKFIRQNKKVDFTTYNFLSAKNLESLNWKGFEKKEQKEVLSQVKAYQRLARLLAEDNPKIIKALLKKNIHSAIQIASIPRQQFLKDFHKLFGGDTDLMREVYGRAIAVRSQALLRYMNIMQSSQRHTKAVKAI